MSVTTFVLLAVLLVGVSASPSCQPKPLYGITYAPFSTHETNICLPVEQVEEDMMLITQLAHSIRLYNIGICYEDTLVVMEAAKHAGMTVTLGLWIDSEHRILFENEWTVLQEMMAKYGDLIEYVVVGNEPLKVEGITVEDIIEYYRRVKEWMTANGYSQPVSVAEVWQAWESPDGFKLVEEVDFLCMNMQPYWEGFWPRCPSNNTSCTSAADYIHQKAAGLEEFFKKKIVLCESGWPTEGEACCSGMDDPAIPGFHAVPSVENAVHFARDLVSRAKERNVKYYLHAGIDDDWKRSWDPCNECKGTGVSKFGGEGCDACVVDYNWGIYSYDRTYKAQYELPEAVSQCDAQ